MGLSGGSLARHRYCPARPNNENYKEIIMATTPSNWKVVSDLYELECVIDTVEKISDGLPKTERRQMRLTAFTKCYAKFTPSLGHSYCLISKMWSAALI